MFFNQLVLLFHIGCHVNRWSQISGMKTNSCSLGCSSAISNDVQSIKVVFSVFTTFESRSCIEVSRSCGARKALPPRGVWGHAPPGNFEILDSWRYIFQHFEAQNGMFKYLFFNQNNPSNKTTCLLLNRSKESNPKFERAFCDTCI